MNLTFLLAAGTGIAWLLCDAHSRRAGGVPFSRAYRAALWSAAVVTGLFALGTGVLAGLGLAGGSGYCPPLTVIFGPISVVAMLTVWALVWYARYQPPSDAPSTDI